jgi:hypothetical protein
MKSLWVLILTMVCACSVPKVQNLVSGETHRSYGFKKSFLPENNYAETKHYYAAGAVTEQDFEDVMEAIRTIYEPIFSSFGATLNVYGDWNDETVNAYADQDGTNWNVNFFGGLAKHPFMTREGFAMVACHEIGHHIAGYPFYAGQWASNEGNSDFYATAACAKMIFDENSPLVYQWDLMKKKPKPTPTPAPGGNCSTSVCKIAMDAGLSLGKVLAELNGEAEPSYETPDKTKVKKTSDAHPKAQCRVDTYKIGAYCTKTWNNVKIPKNLAEMSANSCPERPSCWYAK